MRDDNPFIEIPKKPLPDGTCSETYSTDRQGYSFKKIVKVVRLKTKTKKEERYFCVELPKGKRLPADVLTARGHGYRSISAFHSARMFFESNLRQSWKRNTRFILNK